MTTKIDGLEVISRDSQRGSAEYIYKGVRISKYTRELGHKGRTRGSYVRAGVVFSYKTEVYNAQAIVPSHYSIRKEFTLKNVIAEIDALLVKDNVIVDNNTIIINPADRAIVLGKVNA